MKEHLWTVVVLLNEETCRPEKGYVYYMRHENASDYFGWSKQQTQPPDLVYVYRTWSPREGEKGPV
jgi:hypothetical protein